VAHDTQTPPDLAATLALACLSTAAGGRVSVLVRPEIGWREPVNLYMVAALAPGSRKSPVFSNLTSPITAAEAELVENLPAEAITVPAIPRLSSMTSRPNAFISTALAAGVPPADIARWVGQSIEVLMKYYAAMLYGGGKTSREKYRRELQAWPAEVDESTPDGEDETSGQVDSVEPGPA
jgi:hypothetical protein